MGRLVPNDLEHSCFQEGLDRLGAAMEASSDSMAHESVLVVDDHRVDGAFLQVLEHLA